MAFVDDNEVEEIRGILPIQGKSGFVLREQRLVQCKIHFAPRVHRAAFDFPTCVSKQGEHLVLWIIHQNVTVSDVEDSGSPVCNASSIPVRVPENPSQDEGN